MIEERSGNVTNYRIEGSLQATRQVDCIDLAQASRDDPPPNLYTGIVKCITSDRPDQAAALFVLASVTARFDALRVVDPTVAGGTQILIMRAFEPLTEAQRDAFGAAMDRLRADPARWSSVCAELRRLGPPRYFPRYLVLHGMRAFTAPNPLEGAMKPDFDLDAKWSEVLVQNVKCG